MKSTKLLAFLGVVFILVSCGEPECENTNTIFSTYTPETPEYKNELARQLEMIESPELSYWFDRYESKNEKDYMIVNIHGKELCAEGQILVTDWKKLEGIKRTKGVGYHGAELSGLQIAVQTDSMNTEFIFKGVDYIVD